MNQIEAYQAFMTRCFLNAQEIALGSIAIILLLVWIANSRIMWLRKVMDWIIPFIVMLYIVWFITYIYYIKIGIYG